MMTKREATRRAAALKRRVKGKGWTIHIHENIGWHYCLQLGELKLYEYEHDGHGRFSYSALMGDRPDSPGGAMHLCVDREKVIRDPNTAIRRQLKHASQYLDQFTAIVEHAEDGFGGKGWRAR